MWAIGLFEGEGSVDARERERIPKMRMQLKTTDEDVLERFWRVVGCGRFYGPYPGKGSNDKPYWIWAVHGRDAENLLRRFLPELGERRKQQAFAALHLAVDGEDLDQLRLQVGVPA